MRQIMQSMCVMLLAVACAGFAQPISSAEDDLSAEDVVAVVQPDVFGVEMPFAQGTLVNTST
ncbi:MAG: hypothetical protein H7Y11_11765, partial [Armatimonadetes bacterium]|nr:hypothetical protein [Anaerolineae bacterium]